MSFTLESFAAHCATLAIEVEHETHTALEKSARLVEREAKASLGEYQAGAGPFGGWPQLAEATQEERVRLGFTANDPGLRTGEMRDDISHRVDGNEAHVGSDDDKLLWFELGTSKQPPRSVLGGAAFRKAEEVRDICGGTVVATIAGVRAI